MSVKLQAQSVRNNVERSGTGQACPGLVVEKSGTGIDVEKTGTGIDVEKSGTGRRFWQVAVMSLLLSLAWPLAAGDFSIGLTHYQGKMALVAQGDREVLVGSAVGERGYYVVPIYSLSNAGVQSEGSGSGTASEGSGSGTTSEGSGSGTTSEGSGSGTTSEGSGSGTASEGSGSGTASIGSCMGTASEGSGSGTTSEGSGSGTTSEGSGSGTTSEGSGSGTTGGCVDPAIRGNLWGYAEVVLVSRQSADVIVYRQHNGRLIEHSVHANVVF